jgi:ferredoxin
VKLPEQNFSPFKKNLRGNKSDDPFDVGTDITRLPWFSVVAGAPLKCKGCGLCISACAVGAINGEKKKPHQINADLCIKCGRAAGTIG